MFKQLGCKLEKQTQTVNFWFSQGNFRVNLHFPVIKQRVMPIIDHFYIAILLPIKYKKQILVCRKRMSSHNLAIENGRQL